MRFFWQTLSLTLMASGCGGAGDDEAPQSSGSDSRAEADTSATDTAPTGDTAIPTDTAAELLACEGDVFITHGEGGCFGSDYEWEFKADVAGCAQTALLNIWRTEGEPWDEQHELSLLAEGPDSVWQAWYGLLTHQAPEGSWVPGASTVFDCQLDTGKVTFAVRLLDSTGAMRSCAVWGHDPSLVIAGGASAIHSDAPASFAACEAQPF